MATATPPALEMQTSAAGDLGLWISTRTQPTTPLTSLILDASRTPSMILTGCSLREPTTISGTTHLNGKLILIDYISTFCFHTNIFLRFRCVAYCTSGGYDYAGLQYGSQCICTNSGPQGTSDAGRCNYGCAGDSSIKMCGGLGYINIFHTDAHKTTIDDWGCGNTAQDTYYQKWYNDMSHCGITQCDTTKGSKTTPAPSK